MATTVIVKLELNYFHIFPLCFRYTEMSAINYSFHLIRLYLKKQIYKNTKTISS